MFAINPTGVGVIGLAGLTLTRPVQNRDVVSGELVLTAHSY